MKVSKKKALDEETVEMNTYLNRIYQFDEHTKRYAHHTIGESKFEDRRKALAALKKAHPDAFAYHVELVAGVEPEKKKKQ